MIRHAAKMLGRFSVLGFLTAAIAVSSLPVSASVKVSWPEQDQNIVSETAVLIDADTGAVLYDKDKDRQMYPASITKVMTTLLALEHGQMSDVVTMTETGVAYVQSDSSNLGTMVGEQFTLEQLLYGTMLKSANDMATQVGEYIGGGSLPAFIDMMNSEAAELGCQNTHFVNACGMPDEQHYTSAYDMALIGQEALKNDMFRTIVNAHSYTIPATNMMAEPRELVSHNPLLTNPEYAYPGIIGGKTGNTNAAGNTLTTYTAQNGRTQVVVSLKASDAPGAATDNTLLHNYGYEHFTNVEIISADIAGDAVLATVPIGADVSDVVISDAQQGDSVQLTFTYDGHDAGKALISQTCYDDWQEYLKAESAKAEEAEDVTESEDAESVSEDAEPESAPAPAAERPMGWPLKAGIGIVIGMLVLLIVIKIRADYVRRQRRKRRRLNKQKREDR